MAEYWDGRKWAGRVVPLPSFGARAMQRMLKAGTRFFRLKTVKGPFEPWYCGIVNADSQHVLEKWWECSHCGREYRTRSAADDHSKGRPNQFPPTCLATKKGGACYEGCKHE